MPDRNLADQNATLNDAIHPSDTQGVADDSPTSDDAAPLINPGDRKNPNDPHLPLVSPIVDGGNL